MPAKSVKRSNAVPVNVKYYFNSEIAIFRMGEGPSPPSRYWAPLSRERLHRSCRSGEQKFSINTHEKRKFSFVWFKPKYFALVPSEKSASALWDRSMLGRICG
jgi:hypothetical protein